MLTESENSSPKNHGTKVFATDITPKVNGIPKKNTKLIDFAKYSSTFSLLLLDKTLAILGVITVPSDVISVYESFKIFCDCS